ncbi:hypothetical protein ACFXBB_14445 [Streptomyces scopuliridis]
MPPRNDGSFATSGIPRSAIESGERPKVYFDTDADEGYGCEIRREASS